MSATCQRQGLLIRDSGGISFFSGERGWVYDFPHNMELVLESGEIVNANTITREDLFVALKGGGNNFGYVTHLDFDIFLFPQRSLWGDRGTYKSG